METYKNFKMLVLVLLLCSFSSAFSEWSWKLDWQSQEKVLSFAIHPNDSIVLYQTIDSVKFVNYKTGFIIKTLKSPIYMYDMNFNKDGSKISYAYSNSNGGGINGVGIINYNSFDQIKNFELPTIYCFKYIEDKNSFVFAIKDSIKMFDINSSKILFNFPIIVNQINLLTQYAISICYSKTTNLFAYNLIYTLNDIKNTDGNELRVVDSKGNILFSDENVPYTQISVSNNGNLLAYFAKNTKGHIRIYDFNLNQIVGEADGGDVPSTLHFSYDDKYIFSGHEDKLRMTNVETKKTELILQGTTISDFQNPHSYFKSFLAAVGKLYKFSFLTNDVQYNENLIKYNFLPKNNTLSLTIELSKSSNVNVKLNDVNGRVIKVLENKEFESGFYNSNFPLTYILSGTYIITTTIDEKVQESYKFIKLN